MANQLGIDVDTVIRTKCKDYLETLGDQAESYVQEMKDAAKDAIQAQIDKAEALLKSVQDTAESCISNAPTWSAQVVAIAVPDPMAPKSGAAVLVSLKNSVSMAKANLSSASAQLLDLLGTINGLGVPVPPVVNTASKSITTAQSALDAIPI